MSADCHVKTLTVWRKTAGEITTWVHLTVYFAFVKTFMVTALRFDFRNKMALVMQRATIKYKNTISAKRFFFFKKVFTCFSFIQIKLLHYNDHDICNHTIIVYYYYCYSVVFTINYCKINAYI